MNLNKYIAKEVDEETIKFLKELKQLREENQRVGVGNRTDIL